MIEERFWLLLSKKAFSEASDDEISELNDVLLNHPHLKDTEEALCVLASQSQLPEKNYEAEQAFERHIQKIKDDEDGLKDLILSANAESHTSSKWILNSKTKPWVLTLSSVSVLLISLLIFRHNKVPSAPVNRDKVQLSKVTTKPAQKAQLQLPDGSIVWLNASSNLTYDKDFGKELREVNLTGEAFFDVAKDAAHPFIIHTKVIDVKVTGTQFNVRAYPNDAYTETSLIRGSVEVTIKNRLNEKQHLRPNEKLIVANEMSDEVTTTKTGQPKPLVLMQPLSRDHVDSTVIETSWVQNKLIFQGNETFKEVALRMERWYGVQISFADEEVAQFRPFGSFTKETITEALDALKEGLKFNYTMTGNDIEITK